MRTGNSPGRLAFVAGLVAAPLLVRLVTGSLPGQTILAGAPVLVIAGLLVGFGSVWGNGCTSGHGVCGISRLVDALAGCHRHLHGHRDRDRVSRPALGVTIMPVLLQFVIGLIFGVGLLVSGMSDPAKVLNFLDLGGIRAGTWDPSLAFVMAGAVAVTFIGFKFVLQRPQPLFAEKFNLPGRDDLDQRIVVGPAIFGDRLGTGRAFARVPH